MKIFKKSDPDSGWTVSYEGDCQRESVRVTPPGRHPVRVWIGGISAQVLDISAGGFSVRLPWTEIGETRRFTLRLAEESPEIKGLVQVIGLGPDGICHCQFQELPEEMAETIHQYALNIQKTRLRVGSGSGIDDVEASPGRLDEP